MSAAELLLTEAEGEGVVVVMSLVLVGSSKPFGPWEFCELVSFDSFDSGGTARMTRSGKNVVGKGQRQATGRP